MNYVACTYMSVNDLINFERNKETTKTRKSEKWLKNSKQENKVIK